MKFMIYTIGAILLISSISAALVDFSEEKGWGGDCIGGKRQSPIDFPKNYNYSNEDYFKILSTEYPIIDDLAFAQQPANLKSYNLLNLNNSTSGHLMVRKNGIQYKYNLMDVHFHILAEHTIDGKAYDAEMHMVHIKDNDYLAANNITDTDEDKVNKYLVVGTILQADGKTDNAAVARMNLNTGNKVNNLDFKVFSKPNMDYYHYIGGLTTPDCNQIVNWCVNANPVKISDTQGNTIRKWITQLYPNGNTRVVQQLNGRKLYRINAAETIVIPTSNSAGFLKGNMMMLISVMITAFFL